MPRQVKKKSPVSKKPKPTVAKKPDMVCYERINGMLVAMSPKKSKK